MVLDVALAWAWPGYTYSDTSLGYDRRRSGNVTDTVDTIRPLLLRGGTMAREHKLCEWTHTQLGRLHSSQPAVFTPCLLFVSVVCLAVAVLFVVCSLLCGAVCVY